MEDDQRSVAKRDDVGGSLLPYASVSSSSFLLNLANEWYNHGYSAKDWIDCIGRDNELSERIVLIQMCYYKIKPDYRCEQFLIYNLLYFFFVCSKEDLENMLL